MYEAWPSNKIQKNFFFVFMIVSFFFLSSPRNKIRKNFFQAFGLFDTHSSLIVLRWFNPRVYLYPPSRHSVSSRSHHRRTASPTCHVLSFVPTRPRYMSLRVFFLPFPIRHPLPRFAASTSRSYVRDKVSIYETPDRSSFLALLGVPGIQCSWWVVCVSYLLIYVFVSGCLWVLVAPTPIYLCHFLSQAKFEASISLCRVCSLSSPHHSRPVNRPLSPCFSFLYYVSTVSPLSSFHRASPSFDVFLLYHRCRCRCQCYLASVSVSDICLWVLLVVVGHVSAG